MDEEAAIVLGCVISCVISSREWGNGYIEIRFVLFFKLTDI